MIVERFIGGMAMVLGEHHDLFVCLEDAEDGNLTR